jgi:hypothetical protein
VRRIFPLIFITLLLTVGGIPQVDVRIPPRRERIEAQKLAANFFNAYRKTQDIGPLFNRFFVHDFKNRLKNCRTADYCGGTNRDFWDEDEDLVKLSGSADDHFRKYRNTINYLALASYCYAHLAEMRGKDPSEFEEGGKILEEMLRDELKGNSDTLKLHYDFWSGGVVKTDSLAEFDQLQLKFETLIAALRAVQKRLEGELIRKKPIARTKFLPADFRVYRERNTDAFFGYSKETQVYEVWPEDVGIPPFKLDMVREKGSLRIIAVYPPMD